MQKFWARSKGLIESCCHFDTLIKSGWPDLLVTELGFHINPKENGFRKLVQNFKRDWMVWSKVMAILTRYSSLAGQTSSSPSSDYIETAMKMSPETRAKLWARSNYWIENYSHFDPLLKSDWPDLLVTEKRFHSTLRKTASRTRAKIWTRSNDRIESYGHFDALFKSGWPDLLVTKLGFHINSKENGFRKLEQNFKRDPMIWSKIMAILTRY